MSGTELRIVALADKLEEAVTAVKGRLAADGTLCEHDRAVIAALEWCRADADEQAALVPYALGLLRASGEGRRQHDRRAELEERYGALPPLPEPRRLGTGDPEPLEAA